MEKQAIAWMPSILLRGMSLKKQSRARSGVYSAQTAERRQLPTQHKRSHVTDAETAQREVVGAFVQIQRGFPLL